MHYDADAKAKERRIMFPKDHTPVFRTEKWAYQFLTNNGQPLEVWFFEKGQKHVFFHGTMHLALRRKWFCGDDQLYEFSLTYINRCDAASQDASLYDDFLIVTFVLSTEIGDAPYRFWHYDTRIIFPYQKDQAELLVHEYMKALYIRRQKWMEVWKEAKPAKPAKDIVLRREAQLFSACLGMSAAAGHASNFYKYLKLHALSETRLFSEIIAFTGLCGVTCK